jgi:hypothetical protein
MLPPTTKPSCMLFSFCALGGMVGVVVLSGTGSGIGYGMGSGVGSGIGSGGITIGTTGTL